MGKRKLPHLRKPKTYKDFYELPFTTICKDYYAQIYDSKSNFIFEFLFHENFEKAKLLLDVINGDKLLERDDINFYHNEGCIYYKSPDNEHDAKVILIRGWGNLTSPNCLGLSTDNALNVQNTLAEFIISQLNKR